MQYLTASRRVSGIPAAALNEKEIVVLYQWDTANPDHPKWSQAFSTDHGKPWEWNWEMTLTRIE